MAPVASKMFSPMPHLRPKSMYYTSFQIYSSPSPTTATQFNFLALPAELRTLVYEHVFAKGYGSINKYVKRHVRRLARAARKTPVCSPDWPIARLTEFKTPSMLLVCRQIYYESLPVLRVHSLVMHHGLLDLKLENLITRATFMNLTSIVIYDDGHNILDPKNYPSFAGHRQLAVSMSAWLRTHGHSLRKLELHFESTDLKWHMDHCFHNRQTSCDMRRWVRAVTGAWMQVRGIPEVHIHGWLPQQMKDEMQRLMQSGHCQIARLPTEVICKILRHLVDFDSISRAICRANTVHISTKQGSLPALSTPAVFLVCHQFYEAVKTAARAQPLRLDFSFGPCQNDTLTLTKFVSPMTLQAVEQIQLTIRHRSWLPILFELGNILGQGHSLRKFSFRLEEQRPANFWQTASGLPRFYPDCRLAAALTPLGLITDVPWVHFSGDLDKPAAMPFTERLMIKVSAPRHSILAQMVKYPAMLGREMTQ